MLESKPGLGAAAVADRMPHGRDVLWNRWWQSAHDPRGGCGVCAMKAVTGLPYIPGRAIGRLCFAADADAGAIAVLAWTQLDSLRGTPEAIIVVEPAPLSHSMIRLFGRGRPVVCVDEEQFRDLEEGVTVLVDGDHGTVRECAPGEEVDWQAEVAAWPVNHAPLQTADGVAVQLRASVASAAGAKAARTRGATAIGLVRAEYLVADGPAPPGPEDYETALSNLCRAAAPLAVTLRLSDYGVSKRPTWLEPGLALSPLGRQGLRWFDHPQVAHVVEAQLQAVARLSGQWPLSVLLPFVTLAEESACWRQWARRRLPAGVAVGVMAETPAAVLSIGELLRDADCVGIGCNDLLQGLFEADRDLPEVRTLLDPYAPAVYRLLHAGAEAAGPQCARIQLCGLLSQLPGVMPILVGLGFRAFSVEPLLLPWLDAQVRAVDSEQAQVLARKVCAAGSGAEVRQRIGLAPGRTWATQAHVGG